MAKKENTSSDIISLQSVSKQYGNDTVVKDVNFNVQPGESIVLVGHNGAGKTTLMKLMLGLTRPTSGSVEVLKGNPALTTAVEQRLSLGYLPESVAFYDAMTGQEVLAFYADLKGASKMQCRELLEIVGLGKASKRKVGTYSKGMRQRLGLAQAMLGDPQLLFLDEPTTGLDPLLRQHFYELIENLHEKGVTSIISSHALNEVEARASRFVIMKAGVIVAVGTLDELYHQVNLPTRINLKVKNGHASIITERLGSNVRIDKISEEKLSLLCSKEEKMPLIHHISSLGDDVDDLQIIPPRLDEVYSHYMNGGAS